MTEKENTANNSQGKSRDTEKISRDELLGKASELIRILHEKTTRTRFKESKHDRARLAYARAAVAAITAYGGLLRDAELDEMKKRIEALEQVKERNK
jgi:hypothetical protein